MSKKRNLWTAALCFIVIAAMTVMTLGLTGCQLAEKEQGKAQSDLLIGALVWATDSDNPNVPEDDSISLERVQVETGRGTDIKVSNPDMMGAYVLPERENGEVQGIDFLADDRFVSAPGNAYIGDKNEINATLYFDSSRQLITYVYGVYERADGSLYAKRNSGGLSFAAAGGANTIEEKNGDWHVKVTMHYEPFKAYDKMIVKQFDKNDNCISRTVFAPEDDVKLKKAQGYAYAVCEYIKDGKSDYKLVEDDTVFRVVMNPDNGIGEKRDIVLD